MSAADKALSDCGFAKAAGLPANTIKFRSSSQTAAEVWELSESGDVVMEVGSDTNGTDAILDDMLGQITAKVRAARANH